MNNLGAGFDFYLRVIIVAKSLTFEISSFFFSL